MKLEGKKTYIIGIAMICYAIGGAIIGKVDVNAAIQLGLEALAIMGLRKGISPK